VLADRTTIDIKDKYRNLMTKKRNGAGKDEKSIEPTTACSSSSAGAVKELGILEHGPIIATTEQRKQVEITGRKRLKKDEVLSLSIKDGVPTESAYCSVTTSDCGPPPQPITSTFSSSSRSKDSMTLTVQCEQRTLILNLKGTTKASQLLSFAQKEFNLDDGYVLVSAGVGMQLEPCRPLRDQVPMFDLLRVVRLEQQAVCKI